jgi:hypothetical protein
MAVALLPEAAMTRRRLLLALGLALVIGVPLMVPAVHWRLWGWLHGEAFYQGRPTSYWRAQAADWLIANDWGCIPSLSRHTLPEVLGYERTDWLEKRLHIPPRTGADAAGLWAGDPAAVPVLIELLTCEDSGIAAQAADGLARVGPYAEAAVPALVEVLSTDRTEETGLREGAARALGRVGPKASPAAPVLSEVSQNRREHVDVRRAAAEALRLIDPDAADPLPPILVQPPE